IDGRVVLTEEAPRATEGDRRAIDAALPYLHAVNPAAESGKETRRSTSELFGFQRHARAGGVEPGGAGRSRAAGGTAVDGSKNEERKERLPEAKNHVTLLRPARGENG